MFVFIVNLFYRDIDKVDDLMADINEQQELAQEISDVISRPVGFGEDYDEVRGMMKIQIWRIYIFCKFILDWSLVVFHSLKSFFFFFYSLHVAWQLHPRPLTPNITIEDLLFILIPRILVKVIV